LASFISSVYAYNIFWIYIHKMVFSEIMINGRFLVIFGRIGVYLDIQFGVVQSGIKYNTV